MRALVPQLPGQLRRRLGFEAGLHAGIASAKASLPGESQPSSIALLDSVVEMIEREKGSRWRTDNDLRAGDWIRFEEEFRYGDADTARYLRDLRHDQVAEQALSGLVYFAATDAEAPFVLCGSSVHVLDRWQSGDSPGKQVGHFYMDALIACARQFAELPDEAATTEFAPPGTSQGKRFESPAACPLLAVPGRDAGRPPERLGDRASTPQRACPGPRRGTSARERRATLRARHTALRGVRLGFSGCGGILRQFWSSQQPKLTNDLGRRSLLPPLPKSFARA